MRYILPVASLVFFCLSLIVANYLQLLPYLHFAVPSANDLKNVEWATICLQAFCLLAGIVFGHFHRILTDLRSKGVTIVPVKGLFASGFQSTSFWMGLTAAPLIFGIVVVLTGPIPLGTALFIAFQNGFFWERVMPHGPVNVAGERTGDQNIIEPDKTAHKAASGAGPSATDHIPGTTNDVAAAKPTSDVAPPQ